MIAVGIVGDSITAGAGESSGTISVPRGHVARGLFNAAGGPVPYINFARGGDKANANIMQTTPRKFIATDYLTDIIIALGTNDIGADGASSATLTVNLTTLANRFRSKGLRVSIVTIMPRMTSTTDSYATPGNMTPYTGFQLGGARDQTNTWMAQQVGTLFEAVIDVNPYVEDQANLSKWITTGAANYPTTDGVHPTSALHLLASQATINWAATMRARYES